MKGIVGNYGDMTIEILQSCMLGLCNTVRRETAEKLNANVPGNFTYVGDVAHHNCSGSTSHLCSGFFKVTQCIDRAGVPYNISQLWSRDVADVVADRCHSVVKEEIAIYGSVFGVALIILLAFCCCFAGVYTCAYWGEGRALAPDAFNEKSKLLEEDGSPAVSKRLDDDIEAESVQSHEEHGDLFEVSLK